MTLTRAAALLVALLPAAAAIAQAPADPPICTDRPTKSNVVCTVPAGQIQIEADAINWTRTGLAGTRTDTILAVNPTLKLGIGANTDLEVNAAPYVHVRTRGAGGLTDTGGFGDLYIRAKQRLTDPARALQIGLIPYVKVPTARTGIGNRAWEGGLVAPIQYSLPKGWTLTLGPEIDILHDGDGRGAHVQAVGTINLAKAIGAVTLYGELWSAQNFDPVQTVRQYSADFAVAWALGKHLQFDAGINLGLNRVTPDAQAYLGISTRF